jgi:hypothetical protein
MLFGRDLRSIGRSRIAKFVLGMSSQSESSPRN